MISSLVAMIFFLLMFSHNAGPQSVYDPDRFLRYKTSVSNITSLGHYDIGLSIVYKYDNVPKVNLDGYTADLYFQRNVYAIEVHTPREAKATKVQPHHWLLHSAHKTGSTVRYILQFNITATTDNQDLDVVTFLLNGILLYGINQMSAANTDNMIDRRELEEDCSDIISKSSNSSEWEIRYDVTFTVIQSGVGLVIDFLFYRSIVDMKASGMKVEKRSASHWILKNEGRAVMEGKKIHFQGLIQSDGFSFPFIKALVVNRKIQCVTENHISNRRYIELQDISMTNQNLLIAILFFLLSIPIIGLVAMGVKNRCYDQPHFNHRAEIGENKIPCNEMFSAKFQNREERHLQNEAGTSWNHSSLSSQELGIYENPRRFP